MPDDPNLVQWRNDDPRDTLYKRAHIVILRPNTQGQHGSEVGEGWVETKEGYHVQTTFKDHPSISADDKWDPIWWWVRGPTSF